jgi:hypothetical protein
MKPLVLVLILALLAFGSAAPPQQPTPAAPEPKPVASTDREEMRREIAQMRVLIDQMQRNLAQVSTGESALKHQFDLDIQLWRLMVSRMEKQLGSDRQ